MKRDRIHVSELWPGCGAATRAAFATAFFLALVLELPSPACAGWPLASRAAVTLGFGASYVGSDETPSTHRGVDIGAAAGADVLAPADGTVAFVGRVPGASGGTVLAVTLTTSCGSLTLLPLASASVKRGATPSEGDQIGTLAESGDPSSQGTHLHVGARKGDLYVDPLGVISPPELSGPRTAVPETQLAPSRVGDDATVRTQNTTLIPSRLGATPASRPAAVPAPASPALSPAVPGAQLAEGVSVAGTSRLAAAGSAGAVVLGTQGSSARGGLNDGLSPAERMAGDVRAWATESADRLARGGARAGRVAGTMALGILAALGLLWPLWRRERRKGSVQVGVSVAREDIAAAVGR